MHDSSGRILAALLWLACCGGTMGVAGHAGAADGPREAHGSADAYSAPGVALAWAVLRGATEADARVIIRVAVEGNAFGALAAVGIDPFTQREHPLLPATKLADGIDVRVPRTHFSDFPRTELRLFGSANPAPDDAPVLIVFFLGVPDTAPEFPSAAALESYLVARIAQARTSAGSKRP